MSIWSQFLTNDGRRIHKWTHYFPIYEDHFRRYVNRPCTFVEIGCGEGGSLQLWKRYLGPFARIVGIDIDEKSLAFEEDQIAVRIGDQKDAEFLASVVTEFGFPDVVLDDGSHVMSDVVATFGYLYPRTAPTGIYVVEDLHTAYWDEYEGGVRRAGTFIEKCKSLIDELNADHARGALAPTEFTRTTLSMHVYDSVVVFERGAHLRKHAPRIGRESHLDVLPAGIPRIDFVASTTKPPRPDATASIRAAYLDLLARTLTGILYEDPTCMPGAWFGTYDRDRRAEGRDWPARAESMVGLHRLENIRRCIELIAADDVPGDLLEAGVWRGGASIYMRAILETDAIPDRIVWLADSFRGLPPPASERYPADLGLDLSIFPELAVDVATVRANFEKYGLLDDRVRFIEGWFADTLPAIDPRQRFALIRLDGDLYESTILALDHLYPKLSPNGFILIDDYGAIPACRAAVEDYRRNHAISAPIVEVDWTGVYWRKETESAQ